jgi:hypothetical protein
MYVNLPHCLIINLVEKGWFLKTKTEPKSAIRPVCLLTGGLF